MQYDVFISCKSEDYGYAEEIYEFLKANGIHTFLASKDLRKLGDSEYRKAISATLKSSYHMVIFASQKEYIDSTWVYYEWDWFVNAKLKGFKPGQIITVLKDIHVNDINADLWKYESFTFDDYKDGLLSYVETPSYLLRKEEEQKRKEEEERARRQQEEEQRKRKEAKDKLLAMAEDYRGKVANLSSVDAKKIVSVLRTMGITTHSCPVCKTEVDVTNTYCPTCGWTISPIDDIDGAAYLSLVYPRQLSIAKGIYEKSIEISEQAKLSAKLSEENKVLLGRVTKLTEQIKNLEVQVLEKSKELGNVILERNGLVLSCNELKKKVEDLEKEKMTLQKSLAHCADRTSSGCSSEKMTLQKSLAHSVTTKESQIEKNIAGVPTKATEKTLSQNEQTLPIIQYKKVDLGLSVCWAEHNVGASSPEGYGDYFAWGETEVKKKYTKNTYKFYDTKKGDFLSLSNSIVKTANDVAHQHWGDSWRMPTKNEFKELIEKCDWRKGELRGIKGYHITGVNGNSIFLPMSGFRAAGNLFYSNEYGYYWAGNKGEEGGERAYGCYMDYNKGEVDWDYILYTFAGQTIRPVIDK